LKMYLWPAVLSGRKRQTPRTEEGSMRGVTVRGQQTRTPWQRTAGPIRRAMVVVQLVTMRPRSNGEHVAPFPTELRQRDRPRRRLQLGTAPTLGAQVSRVEVTRQRNAQHTARRLFPQCPPRFLLLRARHAKLFGPTFLRRHSPPYTFPRQNAWPSNIGTCSYVNRPEFES
jgi:hypothetical protein